MTAGGELFREFSVPLLTPESLKQDVFQVLDCWHQGHSTTSAGLDTRFCLGVGTYITRVEAAQMLAEAFGNGQLDIEVADKPITPSAPPTLSSLTLKLPTDFYFRQNWHHTPLEALERELQWVTSELIRKQQSHTAEF